MTMEEISIHNFDFALINEFFTALDRQGPGSPEETLRALSFLDNLSNKTKIADLGCGTGVQKQVSLLSISSQVQLINLMQLLKI